MQNMVKRHQGDMKVRKKQHCGATVTVRVGVVLDRLGTKYLRKKKRFLA